MYGLPKKMKEPSEAQARSQGMIPGGPGPSPAKGTKPTAMSADQSPGVAKMAKLGGKHFVVKQGDHHD